jgi:peptide/nickel transport system permease protein
MTIGPFVLSRLAHAFAVAIGVSFLAFALLETAPGDSAEMIAIARYGAFGFTDQMVAKIREDEGLNSPFVVRYARWAGEAGRGNLGKSLIRLSPVSQELWPRTQSTLALAMASMIVTLLLAFPLGLVPGIWPRSTIGKTFEFVTAAAASVPAFWLGNVLILIFAVTLSWLPAAGDEGFAGLVLPTLSIGIVQAPWMASLLRSAIREASHAMHVRAARSRGVSERGILFRHVLLPGMAPIAALLGLQFAVLLEGAVIVETIFARPGLGRLAVDSVIA